ncbi:MAG: hypothetical protein HOV87_03975 [Catenulispora sp.]|nr:hypothetical protein [Catenulispora sp.]
MVVLDRDRQCRVVGQAGGGQGLAVAGGAQRGNSSLDKQDATWTVRPGLASSSCLSFESKNFPNGYLRQQAGAVYQQQNDGTGQFASDATFCPTNGKNGRGCRWRPMGTRPSTCGTTTATFTSRATAGRTRGTRRRRGRTT